MSIGKLLIVIGFGWLLLAISPLMQSYLGSNWEAKAAVLTVVVGALNSTAMKVRFRFA